MRGGEGKLKAEFIGWVNFCESREGYTVNFREL